MRILWVCNICLPVVAEQLGLPASNKEGWLTGLSNRILNETQSDVTLGLCFPVLGELSKSKTIVSVDDDEVGKMRLSGVDGGSPEASIQDAHNGVKRQRLVAYGFEENVHAAEIYHSELEERFREILDDFRPDIVHCFGTEYPHTLAMMKAFRRPERSLIGIQGLCAVYAEHFRADLPDRIWNQTTFRDVMKHDNLRLQQQKYVARGRYEKEAVRLTGHVAGRTPWDRKYTSEWNPRAQYHVLNETLRANFYGTEWKRENCRKHRIFLSQGDYPIKGLHYVLRAMPQILKAYPDAEVYVAGNSIVKTSLAGGFQGMKGYLKLEAYGRYIRELLLTEVEIDDKSVDLAFSKNSQSKMDKDGEMRQHRICIKDHVTFLGSLTAEKMKEVYLSSEVLLCPSSIENSPNSVGEAMLLGMPVVCAEVGGIPGIFNGRKIKSEIEAERIEKNLVGQMPTEATSIQESVSETSDADGFFYEVQDTDALAKAICKVFDGGREIDQMRHNAQAHARRNHDADANYRQLMAIYSDMMSTD